MRLLYRYLIILVPVACSLGFQGAGAADLNGRFSIRGAGSISCQTYLAERKASSQLYHIVAGWIDGYITARNQFVSDTYDTTSFESMELITALAAEYCKKAPETNLFAVVTSFMEVFATNRLTAPSDKVTVTEGERSKELYAELLKRLQQKLSDLGHYAGEIDGTFDEPTKTALGKFQSSIEFKPTGFPDQLTLWRLFTD